MIKPTRNRTYSLLIVLVILGLAATGLRSNADTVTPKSSETIPGPRIVLRSEYSDAHSPTRIPAPQPLSTLGIGSATITVYYNGSWAPDARNAFEHAVSIWESQLNSTVPIVVEAYWESLGSGVLGSAGATTLHRNVDNEPLADSWYPAALANALEGSDQNGTTHEIEANFNKDFAYWYFGTDGNTPSNRWDFVSVVLHELGHGLGFFGSMTVSSGQGSWGWGSSYPFVYDRFTENGAGQSLIGAFPNYSSALAAQLQSGDVYFDGPNANAANGSGPVKLYAPGTWQQGSSYSHLDNLFNDTPNALMTYSIKNGESIHDPGPVTRGMFQDMGWKLATSVQPDLSLSMQVVGGPDFAPGDEVAFVLSLENIGTGSATGVTVTDLLPGDILTPGWEVSTSLAGTMVQAGTTYVWNLPDLGVGASGLITISGTIDGSLPADFAIVNEASISTTDQESNDRNNDGAAIVGGKRNYLPLVLRGK